MSKLREIFYFRDYFLEFYEELPLEVQKKFDWTFDLIREIRIVPQQFLAAMEGATGLFEVRVTYGGRIFRAFCIFDEGDIVVLFHGFEKKTPKTPQRELKRAIRIQKEYYHAKKTGEIDNYIRRAPR